VKLAAALLLTLAAAGLHFGLTQPARGALVRDAETQRRLRADRRELERHLVPLQKSETARSRALLALPAAALPEGQEAPALRRAILASIERFHVREVKLMIRAGSGDALAAFSLSFKGDLDTLLQAATDVTSRNGIVLSQARFVPGASAVALDLDGFLPRLSR
jgi:hypothetical protein